MLSRPAFRLALMRCAIGAITVALLGSCVDDEASDTELDYRHAVERTMAQYRIPGALAAVRGPGRSEWRGEFGLADAAARSPIDPRSHFAIRSITKSLTVTLILQLARDRAIALDDPIGKYVPGIPNGNHVTLGQLAAMESGVKNYTEVEAFLAAFVADFARPWTAAEIVAYAIPESPVFPPGERYDYSNTNTLLLGQVVEIVTGEPIGEAYRKRILAPLGLAGTDYPNDASLPAPHPTPYEVDPQTGELEELPLINLSALGAAGGMVMTLDDLLAWGEALGTGTLIGAELQALRTTHARAATNGPKYDRYGLGIGQLDGWWGHTGEALGFQAAVFRDPRSGAVIAVMVNSSQPVNVATEIFRSLADVVTRR